MKISAILATKGTNVVTIQPDQSLREAIVILSQYDVGALVVVDDADEPVGIISERDIVREAARNEMLFALPVSRIMTQDLFIGTPNDDVDAVVHTMMLKRFNHLPIVHQGKLAGIVSRGDIDKARLDEYRGAIDTLQIQMTEG